MRSPNVFRIPYRANANFVGRNDVLAKMHEHLIVNPKPDTTASYALYGLGGIGKTQVATQFALQHKEYFDIVWWIHAFNSKAIVGSYMEMSREAQLDAFNFPAFPDQLSNEEVAQKIKSWFETTNSIKWLLIFDNADKLGDEGAQWIPKGKAGCVIVTSRNPCSDGELADAGCEIKELNEDDGADLLLSLSRIQGQGLETARVDAIVLVQVLGGLPLAIEQAGGYIRSSPNMSIAQYIHLFDENRPELLGQGTASQYANTVKTVWRLSFEEIGDVDNIAREILFISAFLDGSKIQTDLFRTADESLPANWNLTTATRWQLEEALRLLKSYSLVRGQDDCFSIHPLVQEMIREYMRESMYSTFCAAIKMILDKFPSAAKNHERFRQCLVYASHAKRCAQLGLTFDTCPGDLRLLLSRLGDFYLMNHQCREAILCYEHLLAVYEHVSGPSHENVADVMCNIALTKLRQGNAEEALSLVDRSMEIYRRVHGPTHVEVQALVTRGLANLLMNNFEEAESCYQQALKFAEDEVEGVKSMDSTEDATMLETLATIRGLLGGLRVREGRTEEGLALLDRAIRSLEKLGAGGLFYAEFLTLFGMGLKLEKKYDQATTYFQRSLQVFNETLGPDHPSSVTTIMFLGFNYTDHDNLAEATSNFERALHIFDLIGGPPNPIMLELYLRMLALMAQFKKNQNLLEEEAALHERALKVLENTSGTHRINRIAILGKLSNCCRSLGKYIDERRALEYELQLRDEEFGPEDAASVEVLRLIGSICQTRTTKYTDAINYFERAKRICELNHIGDQQSLMMKKIGRVHELQGKYDEAMSMYKHSREACDSLYGSDHIESVLSVCNMGFVYELQGKLDAAMTCFDKCLAICSKCDDCDPNALVWTYLLAAVIYSSKHDYQNVLSTVEKANAGDGGEPEILARTLRATAYRGTKQFDSASAEIEAALKLTETEFGRWHMMSLATLETYALLQLEQGNTARCIEILRRVLDVYDTVLGEDNVRSATAIHYLGKAFAQEGDLDLSAASFKRALKIVESNLGSDNIKSGEILKDLGTLYLKAGDKPAARNILLRAEKIFATVLGKSHGLTQETRRLLRSMESLLKRTGFAISDEMKRFRENLGGQSGHRSRI